MRADPIERKAFHRFLRPPFRPSRKLWWILAGSAATAVAIVWLWGVFGWPWQRLAGSFDYLAQCAKSIVTGVSDEYPMPEAPIIKSDFVEQAKGNLGNFLFAFRAGAVAMTNPLAVLYSLADLGNNFNAVMRVAVWLLYIPLFALLFREIVMEPRFSKDAQDNDVPEAEGPTPAASAMRRLHFRFVAPSAKAVRQWWRWIKATDVSRSNPRWREQRRRTGIWFWWFWCLLALVFSGLLPDAMDFLSFYFVFTRTLFKVSAFPLIVSFAATLADDLAKLGPFWDSAIAAYVAYLICKAIAVSGIIAKLEENSEKLDHMGVATLIMGPQGSGKTQMMWFMCYLMASKMRAHALRIMMRYRYAFRLFDWRKIEVWVMQNSLTPEEWSQFRETGHLPEKADSLGKRREIYNRVDIKDRLIKKFANYLRGDDDFFGYDRRGRMWFFNGARKVSLIDAAIAYGQSWFLYFPDRSLLISNIGAQNHSGREGTTFPVYDGPEAILKKGCRPQKESDIEMAADINFDGMRVINQLRKDPEAAAGEDGGVHMITEIDKERGDSFAFAKGKSKAGQSENPTNSAADGFNTGIKLGRHTNSIDGENFNSLFMDTQRPTSLNADLRDSCEDKITIVRKGDVEVGIPFYFVFETAADFLIGKWERWFLEFQKYRPGVETGYNELLAMMVTPLYNTQTRLLNFYGCEEVTIAREKGGSTMMAGQSTVEVWHNLWAFTRSKSYETDCYHVIMDERKRGATKGRLQVSHFEKTEMSLDELDQQNSNFVIMMEKFTGSFAQAEVKAANIVALPPDQAKKPEPAEKPSKKPKAKRKAPKPKAGD